jgi:hypothetical protein
VEEEPTYDRDSLLASGWQQGSLLPEGVPIHPVAWIGEQTQGWPKARKDASNRARNDTLTGPYLYTRPPTNGDRMALITQDCDILKPPEEFPYVEFALVLETSKAGVINEAASLTSARYFRVDDPGAGTPAQVLDFRFKAQADKGVLLQHQPGNHLLEHMDDRRRAMLREWLGRRLGREAVSDEDTRRIVEPVREAWKELSVESPATARAWEAKTSELRFRHAEDGRLQLYVITHDAIDPADVDLLELTDWAVQTIDWPETLMDVTVTNEWEMTIGEHRATQEIDLAWASYEESEEAA